MADQPTPMYPEMPKNEYEWLHCTVYPGGSMAVYRHRMSNRAVIVASKSKEGEQSEVTTLWLPPAVTTVLKASF